MAGVDDDRDPVKTIGRLGARLMLQQALGDEVTEYPGRVRYERAGERVSHRNGYEPRTTKTTSGPVTVERPPVRDASKLGFESRILGKHRRWGKRRLDQRDLVYLFLDAVYLKLHPDDTPAEGVLVACGRHVGRPKGPARVAARLTREL
jgi:transposase-like protein